MFDCVLPRGTPATGWLFHLYGDVQIRKRPPPRRHACRRRKLSCAHCAHFSRAYLHHLQKVNENPRRPSQHRPHLHYYQTLIRELREAIAYENSPIASAHFARRADTVG